MTTIHDIFNICTGNEAIIEKSLYYQENNSVVRFSDHPARYYNVSSKNEGVDNLLLVFVNADMTEYEMQQNAEEIESELGINVEYTYYNDGEDTSYIEQIVKRFLK